jgi:hypothetical protein
MAGLGVQPGGRSIGNGGVNVLGIEDGGCGCVVHKKLEKSSNLLGLRDARPEF